MRITQDEYDKKAIELKERQRQINAELKIHNDADEQFAVTLTSLISLASKAYEIFESSKIIEKRQLIAFMFSNLRMNGTKLLFDLKQPFNLMMNLKTNEEWLRLVYVFRTNSKEEVINFGLTQAGNIRL